jgi:hypothetical protein
VAGIRINAHNSYESDDPMRSVGAGLRPIPYSTEFACLPQSKLTK